MTLLYSLCSVNGRVIGSFSNPKNLRAHRWNQNKDANAEPPPPFTPLPLTRHINGLWAGVNGQSKAVLKIDLKPEKNVLNSLEKSLLRSRAV